MSDKKERKIKGMLRELLGNNVDVVGEKWRILNPNHCPIVLRDGDGKSAGACYYHLNNGICPQHGKIYVTNYPNSL
jgi:hypothetical protein